MSTSHARYMGLPERRGQQGTVSVVIVNFQGAERTLEAVKALESLNWPDDALEIVIVDNHSGDGSAERIRRAAPHAVLIEADSNLGFAGGCNLGVAASKGCIVAFLNSDARPHADWIASAMDVFDADSSVAAVASKVLDWDGEIVDFVDAALTWFGKGYKPYVGEPVGALGAVPKDVLFGTGSAMLVRREVFSELGGFDENFFMFYEDVDFGWRLNLRGWRFRYEPTSVAYHAHHGTVSQFGAFKETYLLERNALLMLFKNLEQASLDSALPAALALTVRRGIAAGGLDSSAFDYRKGASDDVEADEVPRVALASAYAVDQFVELLPAMLAARKSVQSTRRVSDRDVWSLFGRTDAVAGVDNYVQGHETLATVFPVAERPEATKVLIITGDPLGARMAGPAIRAWNMALALSGPHEVTVMTTSRLDDLSAPFRCVRVRAGDNRSFAPWESWADVIIFQGHAMATFPALRDTDKVVVVDVYDPMHLEQLEQGRHLPAATWDRAVSEATEVLNEQLSRGDFFLCASERQRMFYLGQLAALGRLNPAVYAADPSARGLIDVAPFGLESTPPRHERDVLKGVVEGIGPDDKLLLWGGGLYNWFDPLTLIRAVAELSRRRPTVKLFFQGTKHPHPGVPEMEIVGQSRALATELGILNSHVFFNEEWVEYADRQNYLTEADAGVSTHYVHLETSFSFRTRILDYLWASLPMVVTEGDHFAEVVESEGLGVVVPERDVDALAAALETVLYDADFVASAKASIERVRQAYVWEATLEPVTRFLRVPRRAADAVEQKVRARGASVRAPRRRKPYGLLHNADLIAHHWRNGGPRVVLRKVLARLQAR